VRRVERRVRGDRGPRHRPDGVTRKTRPRGRVLPKAKCQEQVYPIAASGGALPCFFCQALRSGAPVGTFGGSPHRRRAARAIGHSMTTPAPYFAVFFVVKRTSRVNDYRGRFRITSSPRRLP